MRLSILLALGALSAALVGCQPDYPQDSALGDSHDAVGAKPDLQQAPPMVQEPADTLAQIPPAEAPMANGPPTNIIQPPPSP